MADTKISALTTATTLDGTEVLPVVQSSTTKKTTINSIIADLDLDVISNDIIVTLPFGIAPSGTIGDAADINKLVLGTATPILIPSLYLYFPANAVESGSAAGFYYCEMSSTTLGQVYSDRFLSAVDELPTKPVSPSDPTTGYSSATAYTGVGTTITDALSITITGGTLGNNGYVYIHNGNLLSNTANNKGIAFELDGVSIGGWVTATNKATVNAGFGFVNRQDEASQLMFNNTHIAATSHQRANGSVDTSLDKQLTVDLVVSAATDYSICDYIWATVRGTA